MKMITVGEKDRVNQGLSVRAMLNIFLVVYLSGIYSNASLCWKYRVFSVSKLPIIRFIMEAEPYFLSLSKATPCHLFY